MISVLLNILSGIADYLEREYWLRQGWLYRPRWYTTPIRKFVGWAEKNLENKHLNK